LHLLLRNDHLVCMRIHEAASFINFIWEANPKVLSVRDNEGFTPLHTACSKGMLPAYHGDGYAGIELLGRIRSLITGAPDVLVLQDSSGRTPLHLLLRKNDWPRTRPDLPDPLINFIWEANPKVLSVCDNEGFTPCYWWLANRICL
jgi:ankyrin repeat protein